MEAQQGGIFGDTLREKPKRYVSLSHRELAIVNTNKRKYSVWLNRWERDTGVGRFLMLNDFLKQCIGFSHAQLDELYGHASELVFIHIYAFLRLNYRRACSIALQLKCIRIFFDASSGYCFAYHFLSTGGSLLLLELLKMQDNLNLEDVLEAMQCFLSLTAHGPKAQQLLTDTKIAGVFTTEMPRFSNEELHKMTVLLFAQLADGDPVHAEIFCNAFRTKFSFYGNQKGEALATAAHIFRILFSPAIAAECDVKNTIADFLALTSTDRLDIQHEAIAIFEQLLDNAVPARRKFLFDVIIDLITVNADEVPPDLMEQRLVQQTFGVRLFQSVLRQKSETSSALFEFIQRILPALIRAVGNTQNFAAQKASCVVIGLLVGGWPVVKSYLTNAMPAEWATELLRAPQQFCLQLTPTQIDTFQGAEAQHFFFDVIEEAPVRLREIKRGPRMTSTGKPPMGQTANYIQIPIIMRPAVLKYVPTGSARGTRVEIDVDSEL
jgi:hypothetical protein